MAKGSRVAKAGVAGGKLRKGRMPAITTPAKNPYPVSTGGKRKQV